MNGKRLIHPMFVFNSYDDVEDALYKEPATYVDVFYADGHYRFNRSCFCSAEVDMSPRFSTLEDLAAGISRLDSPVVFTVRKRLTMEEIQAVESICRENDLEASKEHIRGLADLEMSVLMRHLEERSPRPRQN